MDKGYFLNVGRQDPQLRHLLNEQCFWDAARRRYVNERHEVLRKEVLPCGVWGSASYRLLDDLISAALGIPRVPED